VAGVFQTHFQPGDAVEQGQLIATIDDHPLQAPLTGVLRGVTHTQVPVTIKTKIIEVDPRGAAAQITGISERPARIAQGVLKAVRDWQGS
jgi:xanthine dehydrogenase accessory factor